MTDPLTLPCPKCGGRMAFYDGMLGYESIQCTLCHYDVNDSLIEEEQAAKEREAYLDSLAERDGVINRE